MGDFDPDVFVDSRLIVELKSITAMAAAHEVQLVNYLSATRIDDGFAPVAADCFPRSPG